MEQSTAEKKEPAKLESILERLARTKKARWEFVFAEEFSFDNPEDERHVLELYGQPQFYRGMLSLMKHEYRNECMTGYKKILLERKFPKWLASALAWTYLNRKSRVSREHIKSFKALYEEQEQVHREKLHEAYLEEFGNRPYSFKGFNEFAEESGSIDSLLEIKDAARRKIGLSELEIQDVLRPELRKEYRDKTDNVFINMHHWPVPVANAVKKTIGLPTHKFHKSASDFLAGYFGGIFPKMYLEAIARATNKKRRFLTGVSVYSDIPLAIINGALYFGGVHLINIAGGEDSSFKDFYEILFGLNFWIRAAQPLVRIPAHEIFDKHIGSPGAVVNSSLFEVPITWYLFAHAGIVKACSWLGVKYKPMKPFKPVPVPAVKMPSARFDAYFSDSASCNEERIKKLDRFYDRKKEIRHYAMQNNGKFYSLFLQYSSERNAQASPSIRHLRT